jgi:phytoene desaturase
VSNTGPKKTVTLAGEEHFDRGYLKDVRDSKPLNGILFILACDGPLFDCPGGIFTTDTQRTHLWFDFTLTWPEWAPKGKNWVYAWQTPDPSSNYDPKKEYEIMLADIAQTFPTFAAQNGKVLLAKHHCAEWPAARAGACQDLRQKTPVENLFNVGDGVKTPEFIGGSGAAESARIVADEIKMRIRP